MKRAKHKTIEDLVKGAHGVYLEIIQDEIEKAREKGDTKHEIELVKELIRLGR